MIVEAERPLLGELQHRSRGDDLGHRKPQIQRRPASPACCQRVQLPLRLPSVRSPAARRRLRRRRGHVRSSAARAPDREWGPSHPSSGILRGALTRQAGQRLATGRSRLRGQGRTELGVSPEIHLHSAGGFVPERLTPSRVTAGNPAGPRDCVDLRGESGRLDLNQRPLGPQPARSSCRCVPERPPASRSSPSVDRLDTSDAAIGTKAVPRPSQVRSGGPLRFSLRRTDRRANKPVVERRLPPFARLNGCRARSSA